MTKSIPQHHQPVATKRRPLAAVVAAFGALGCSVVLAQTDAYPTKAIKWIVPFPPGGAMDSIARTLGEQMSRQLSQPFVIENRAGAGGNIGAESVAKASPDGYTMIIVANGMAVNKFLYGKLSYDSVKAFSPISLLAVVPNVLVTNAAQSKGKTVAEVIAQAKAQPGKVTFASAGNGTSIHLAGELFASMANVEMLHVPYKGSGPAVTDLIGGQVDYMFDSVTSAMPHIQSGKLRAIAVTTVTRSSALSNVPTIAEAGLPGYELSPWFAAYMPAGTPDAIVAQMNEALLEAMKTPTVKARFAAIGAEPIGSTPKQLAVHLDAEMLKWGKIIQTRGIRAD
ncbi:tripartite tricarboxylate transporter substrate binding protein [Variovorax sp. J22R24]|uniref:Bug family tripartite tricarboxylate transporter substrate binding protein n=1 Tax=Variovorax gracilis TaxID=3053502 RepID=UPI002574C09A|nr:tripartite tricarboxylate transporter substrate binding protein [Variovorax sp. J22R24]MDM0110397.1 tripartite tricarboxylate transporter substrate binding protein [Variovorax sp. J22R24]